MRRGSGGTCALVAALLVGGGCSAGTRSLSPTEATAEPRLRVMTYNVNYGLAGDADTIAAIVAGDADVVLLQETNEAWEQRLRDALGERYPHMQFRHCCLAGGLGVLSRYPFDDGGTLKTDTHGSWFPAWRVVVHSPAGAIQMLNVHLRPQVSEGGSVVSGYFSTPAVREAEITDHHRALDPALPTVVAGDFNESGGGRALEYLQQRGFADVLHERRGSAPTWRWQTSVGPIRMQLDHLVIDERLRVLDVRVLDGGRSDHLPVVGDFQRRKQPPLAPATSTNATERE